MSVLPNSTLPNSTSIMPVGSGGPITASQYWNNTTINATNIPKDYVIQGQMYTARMSINDSQIQEMTMPVNPDDIKMQLCYKIAEELFKNKAIEFTKMEDHMSGTHTFTARIYAVPDTMVRILRENGK